MQSCTRNRRFKKKCQIPCAKTFLSISLKNSGKTSFFISYFFSSTEVKLSKQVKLLRTSTRRQVNTQSSSQTFTKTRLLKLKRVLFCFFFETNCVIILSPLKLLLQQADELELLRYHAYVSLAHIVQYERYSARASLAGLPLINTLVKQSQGFYDLAFFMRTAVKCTLFKAGPIHRHKKSCLKPKSERAQLRSKPLILLRICKALVLLCSRCSCQREVAREL